MPATICVWRSSSGTAMTEAMALSLMAMTKSEPSAGSMRISACGRMMVRIAWKRLMPSASAACIWLRRTEVRPARIGLGDIGAEMDAEPGDAGGHGVDGVADEQGKGEEGPDQHGEQRDRPHRVDVEAEHHD